MEQLKGNSSVGCQESDTHVWRHPSGEEGWKNSSLREFDGPLSLEERRICKTPQEMAFWEEFFWRSDIWKGLGGSTNMGMSLRAQEARIFLIGTMWMVFLNGWTEAKQGLYMWKTRQKEVDLQDPTPLIDQVCLGCTDWDAKVHPQAVQSKTEVFKKLTTTRKSDEEDQTEEKHWLEKITDWCFDMEGHAEKCVDRHCECAKKNVSSFQQLATPCIDDHPIPLRLCSNECIWPEVDDHIYCGQ